MQNICTMQNEDIELRIRGIDERVKKLERTNDNYMKKYGCHNDGVYQLIQNLMDQRDELRRLMAS